MKKLPASKRLALVAVALLFVMAHMAFLRRSLFGGWSVCTIMEAPRGGRCNWPDSWFFWGFYFDWNHVWVFFIPSLILLLFSLPKFRFQWIGVLPFGIIATLITLLLAAPSIAVRPTPDRALDMSGGFWPVALAYWSLFAVCCWAIVFLQLAERSHNTGGRWHVFFRRTAQVIFVLGVCLTAGAVIHGKSRPAARLAAAVQREDLPAIRRICGKISPSAREVDSLQLALSRIPKLNLFFAARFRLRAARLRAWELAGGLRWRDQGGVS